MEILLCIAGTAALALSGLGILRRSLRMQFVGMAMGFAVVLAAVIYIEFALH